MLLALAGAPLFAIIAAIGLLAFNAAGIDTAALIAELYRLVDFPALIAIPLFTFAGYVLAESQAPRRLVALAQALFGWMPGGLGRGGRILHGRLHRLQRRIGGHDHRPRRAASFPPCSSRGIRKRFSLGLMTTSGSLGLLFPPSLPIILYSIVAGVSIDKLFVAGLVPGHPPRRDPVARTASGWESRQRSRAAPFAHARSGSALKEAAWEAPLPLVVIGGIYGGFIHRHGGGGADRGLRACGGGLHPPRDLVLRRACPKVIKESMILVGAILVMLGAAMGVTSYIIDQQIPMKLFAFISHYVSSKLVFLIILNLFILVMNMVEIFSAIIIVVPIIVPVALQYGVDPVHLGIIFLLNLEIGYMTPPLGLNLFLSSLRFGKPLSDGVQDGAALLRPARRRAAAGHLRSRS